MNQPQYARRWPYQRCGRRFIPLRHRVDRTLREKRGWPYGAHSIRLTFLAAVSAMDRPTTAVESPQRSGQVTTCARAHSAAKRVEASLLMVFPAWSGVA